MIIAVTGAKGSGKSSSLLKTAEILKFNNLSVAGIICRRIWKEDKRYGYELLNLSDNVSQLLAAEEDLDDDVIKHFNLSFRKKALTDGVNAITQGCDADVLIIDEIGNMEASGGGWSDSFPFVLKRVCRATADRAKPTILGVRENILDKLKEMGLPPDEVITVLSDYGGVSEIILDILSNRIFIIQSALRSSSGWKREH